MNQRSKTPSVSSREPISEEFQKCRTEVKRLRIELKESQDVAKRLSNKNSELRQRVATSRSQELALRQYNRMLLDMVRGYMDREAVLLANTRTVTQAYQVQKSSDPVQEKIHEIFEDE